MFELSKTRQTPVGLEVFNREDAGPRAQQAGQLAAAKGIPFPFALKIADLIGGHFMQLDRSVESARSGLAHGATIKQTAKSILRGLPVLKSESSDPKALRGLIMQALYKASPILDQLLQWAGSTGQAPKDDDTLRPERTGELIRFHQATGQVPPQDMMTQADLDRCMQLRTERGMTIQEAQKSLGLSEN